jgi:hypothetical protein
MKEDPSREYPSDHFGQDFFSGGILVVYFDLVVVLKISFIPPIEFTDSTRIPLLILVSPMSWKRPFFGCCPVPGEPSDHCITIWSAEFSLKRASLPF